MPGVRPGLRAVSRRMVGGASGGPDPQTRAKTTTEVIAVAYDPAGRELSSVRMTGGNSYEFSAHLLAWGAVRAADACVRGTGALGPVEAVGLEALEIACREAGLERVSC